MTTPIENLRAYWAKHRSLGRPIPDVGGEELDVLLAALDALEARLVAAEEEIQDLLALRPTRGQLVQRLDAATVLIRQAMEERHYSIRPNTGDSETRCGSPLGTSIDTCPNCRPYREWLEGEGQ